MLKTFVTATAISALMVSGAMAQMTPAPSQTDTPKAAPKEAPAAGSPQFIAAQKSDQWLASRFQGTDVIGPNNEKIGDVNDVLFDKEGKLVGIVVGVGGFLGIGQKDVAIDMAAFQMVPASTGRDTTGSTAAAMDDPNDVKLKVAWTKEQLKEAPGFQRYRAPARTTGTTGSGNTGQRAPMGSPTR